MKTTRAIIMSLLSITLILSSCVTRKKLTYLQDSDKPDNSIMPYSDSRITVTPDDYKIRLYDNLYIRVITPDPQWSEMFNTVSATSGGTLTEQSAALLGYPVDGNGDIELPFAGKLKVVGKTLSEIKFELDLTLKKYVTDAAITVRMVNNFVSIIGEVRNPGRYPLIKDHLNVFEALSLAGDMGDYSNRQKVQLIRQSTNGPIVKEFSLTDRSILTSEFYYVIPNDIIYAKPMRGKIFQMNSSIYSMIFSSITSFLVIFSFFSPH